MSYRIGPAVLLGVGSLLALASVGIAQDFKVQEYVIGPSDVLKVVVWGQEDLSKEYTVSEDGTVPFPLIGQVKAAGRTTLELATQLTELLSKDYLVNPQVRVSVAEYRSKKVHVLGEAEKPGLYYLTGNNTILEILSKAGGLSRTGGKQVILIRPHMKDGKALGSSILRLSMDRIQAGDVGENILVQDEDTIIVPKNQAFFVLGEVKSPGTYPIDKETTVLDAVTLAGGFTDHAARSGAKLIRRSPEGKEETIPLDLSGSVPRDRGLKVENGDTIMVPKGNTFFVFGEVKKPGSYQLDKDTTVLEAITLAGGFTDKAAPGRAKIIRNTAKGEETIHVNLNDVIKHGKRDKALAIHENDVIVVPESFF